MKAAGSETVHRTAHLPPNERVEVDEQLEQLGRALDQLDPDERLAVHLFYLQEASAPSAMRSMPNPVSRSGFYKLLTRAREKLAALMSADRSQAASCPQTNERVV